MNEEMRQLISRKSIESDFLEFMIDNGWEYDILTNQNESIHIYDLYGTAVVIFKNQEFVTAIED